MDFNATFIVAFISFIIFIIIMNFILYKPIGDIIEKRQKFIDDNYNEAKNNSLKSEAILKDRDDKIHNAQNLVRQKTHLAIQEAKDKKNNLLANAKEEAKIKFEENSNNLNQQKSDAQNTLKNDVINLAQIISDKFIPVPERIENADYELIENIMKG